MRETGSSIRERAPAGWDALLETDPNATPAHRPVVWDMLAATIPGLRSRFVAVERDGALLGGAPVMVLRRAGFHRVHALPFMLSGAPLAQPGRHAEVDAATAAALGGLCVSLGVIGGEWSLYRPEGPAPAAALEAAPGETRAHDTWIVDLSGGAGAVWRRLDRNARHMLRRATRGGPRFAEEPDALDEAYARHLRQARAWGGAHRPLPLELSRRLLEARDSAGPAARLFTVRVRGRLEAAILCLDHPRETFAWWSGAGASARATGAMPLLFWRLIEWAAAAGRARLNLGGSAGRPELDAFKRQFGARLHRHPVLWFDARAARGVGRLVAGLQGWARRGRFRGTAA